MLSIPHSLGNEGKLKEKKQKNQKKIFEGSPGTHALGGKLILKSRSERGRGVSISVTIVLSSQVIFSWSSGDLMLG